MRLNILDGRISGALEILTKRRVLKQALGAALTLTTAHPNRLVLDPGGAARNVTLPAEASGLWFEITNSADAAENLTILEDAGSVTQAIVGPGQTITLWSDGTSWFVGGAGEGANGGIVNLTATATLTRAAHGGKLITLNAAAGLTITLPAAIGSGARFEFFVGTTVTSNNDIIQVVGNDTMKGTVWMAQDAADTAVAFETASDSDTITMNGTTKGGLIGDRISLIDAAADVWSLQAFLQGTGTEATPLSAAVT